MSFKKGQAVCIFSRKTNEYGHYRILCEVDGYVVYCNETGVYVRDVDDMTDRTIEPKVKRCKAYRDAKAAWLDIIEHGDRQVKSTYGFYLFGKYKCRERGQWIPCQVAYNERTRAWSVDTHEEA